MITGRDYPNLFFFFVKESWSVYINLCKIYFQKMSFSFEIRGVIALWSFLPWGNATFSLFGTTMKSSPPKVYSLRLTFYIHHCCQSALPPFSYLIWVPLIGRSKGFPVFHTTLKKYSNCGLTTIIKKGLFILSFKHNGLTHVNWYISKESETKWTHKLRKGISTSLISETIC